jgi:hypothetical protein
MVVTISELRHPNILGLPPILAPYNAAVEFYKLDLEQARVANIIVHLFTYFVVEFLLEGMSVFLYIRETLKTLLGSYW